MSKSPDNANGDAPSFSDADIAKARQWFKKGQELAAKKSFDYAIESYITGLNAWPEAVEEGHKPCRAAALFRGAKKVGFGDQFKYKTGGRDAKKAMLNAEMLLSKDPGNLGYMEAVLKNAVRGGYDETAMWIGEILADASANEAKPNPGRFVTQRKLFEELGQRNENRRPDMAIAAYQRAVAAQSRLQALKPQDMDVSTDLRDLAGKLTILKGRYGSAESFRDSVHDSEGQKELHDKERAFQSDERMEQLIATARKRYEAEPTKRSAINELVDLLTRRDNVEDENQAIELLNKASNELSEYRFKMRADDIRIRQLNRKAREVATKGDKDQAHKHLRDQLRFELSVFKERSEQYPTDLRIRFQYGLRLFRAGRFDDAIPVLQEARADLKARSHCNLYISRCFFEKGYFSQAIDTLEEAIRTHEPPDDDLGKELHYRLGRSYESDGRTEDALKTYGQLIQWDYNYRSGEVRKRLDALKTQ